MGFFEHEKSRLDNPRYAVVDLRSRHLAVRPHVRTDPGLYLPEPNGALQGESVQAPVAPEGPRVHRRTFFDRTSSVRHDDPIYGQTMIGPRAMTFLRLGAGLLAAALWLDPAVNPRAQSPVNEVDQVLQKMDDAGKGFRSLSADIFQKKYTAVLQEFDTEEKGTFAYTRTPDGQALIRKEITSPTSTVAIINRDQGLVYHPRIKQAQRFQLGQHKDKAEFLAIGVGQSAGKLKANFAIRILGRESIEGAKVVVMELRPKSEKTAAFLSVITLWLDEQRWVPIQTRLQEPNDDYLLTRFRNLKLNAKIPDSLFSLKLPADVEVIG